MPGVGEPLSDAVVRDILRRYRQGATMYRIARDVGVSSSSVWGIVHGRRHVDVTGGEDISRDMEYLRSYRDVVISAGKAQGRSNASIARELGMSRTGVWKRARDLKRMEGNQ